VILVNPLLIFEYAEVVMFTEPAKVLRTLSRSYAAGALIFGCALAPISLSAQETELSHLDCWFDETEKAVKCPPVGALQTGRASRVDNAFTAVGGPARDVNPVAQESRPPPPPKSRPIAVASNDPKTPSCTKDKTYDPATRTYRGYDRVIRKCR